MVFIKRGNFFIFRINDYHAAPYLIGLIQAFFQGMDKNHSTIPLSLVKFINS